MRRLGYVPALDGLRGVAIAAVVLYHTRLMPSGFLGVDLFFVQSGFLITSLLLDEQAERGVIAFASFYRRRARRLLPVAIAGIIFGEALTLAVSGFGRDLIPGLFAFSYVENLAQFLLHPPAYDRFIHYWSLSQEEQFYLIWPPLLAWALRRRVSLAKLACALIGFALIVMVHRSLVNNVHAAGLTRPDMRADGILLGCALAAGWRDGMFRPSRVWGLAGVIGAVVFTADAAFITGGANASLYGVTIGTVAAAAMVAAVILAPTGPIPQLLALRPLRWLGKISYSLYIWHVLIAEAAGLKGLPLIATAIVVSWLSYRLIERPFRQRRRAHLVAPLNLQLSPAPPAA